MKTILTVLASLFTIGLAAVGVGRFLFRRKTKNLVSQQETAISEVVPNRVKRASLPVVVSNYLRMVLPNEMVTPTHITLKQRGEIQTKPGTWNSFTATQHIFLPQTGRMWPGFVWTANLFPIYVRDSFLDGQGETLVSLLGLKLIERSTGPEINQGAWQRNIGELCWFPAALLDNHLSWKEQHPGVVEATMLLDGVSASGVFTFDEAGLIRQFEADRYRSQDGTYRLTRWRVTVDDYQSFAGVRVPTKAVAMWLLPEGNFEAIRIRLVAYETRILPNSLTLHNIGSRRQ